MLPSEVLGYVQSFLTEKHKREVEDDVSGINRLLFEHLDADKNGTVECEGLH